MSDETTLLPCPWCGEYPKIAEDGGSTGPWFSVWHDCPPVEGGKARHYGESLGCISITTAWFQTEAEAIAAWNTRAYLNQDGLPNGLTISDDGNLLNWRGENYVRQAIAVTLSRPKAKAHPYGYEPDTGAFDCTRCECGCINDISATYCNDCGGEIEIDMYAEKEIYHTLRHLVFAEKHDDGSLEFGGKRYVAATLGSERDEIYNAGFDNGIKATLHQLDGLLVKTDSAVEIQAWVDEQWKEYES